MLLAASVAVNIGMAYSGNPAAGIAAVTGAVQLFSNQRPPKDPVIDLINQRFAELNARLDTLFQRIDAIDRKLDRIMLWQYESHQEVMNQLWYLETRIDAIDRKLDYVVELLQQNPRCASIEGTLTVAFRNRIHGYSQLSQFQREFDNHPFVKSLYSCIYDIVNAGNPFAVGVLHNPDANQLTNDYPRLLSMLSEAGAPLRAVRGVAGCSNSRLLNPEVITVFTELVIDLEPYLYFGDSAGRPVAPASITEQEHAARHQNVLLIYEVLGRLTTCALAQHSLIQGGVVFDDPVLNMLQAAAVESNTPWEATARQVLDDQRASILRANLGAQIVATMFHGKPYAFDLLRQAEDSIAGGAPATSVLDQLNSLAIYPGVRFEAVKIANTPLQLGLQIRKKFAGDTGVVTRFLPLLPVEYIQDGEPSVFRRPCGTPSNPHPNRAAPIGLPDQ